MFAALVLAAGVAPAQPPAPLPDRWLLKLAPAELPPLPSRFYDATWFDAQHAAAPGYSWERWFRFAPTTPAAREAVTITKRHDRPPAPGDDPTRRVLPLAVHGPLVEFDGKLYTAAVASFRSPKQSAVVTHVLHLGAAVSRPGNVWYQASTQRSPDGKAVAVVEWRLEFKDDPRTTAGGTLTARHHRRLLAEPKGTAMVAEWRFSVSPVREPGRGRSVNLFPPDDFRGMRPLLELGDESGEPDRIWEHAWDRLRLTPAARPAPAADVPGLVQPPKG